MYVFVRTGVKRYKILDPIIKTGELEKYKKNFPNMGVMIEDPAKRKFVVNVTELYEYSLQEYLTSCYDVGASSYTERTEARRRIKAASTEDLKKEKVALVKVLEDHIKQSDKSHPNNVVFSAYKLRLILIELDRRGG